MKVLLTGFEPYLNYQVNPSQRLAKELDQTKLHETFIIGKVLLLEYRSIKNQIRTYIKEIEPDAILMTGQASRPVISIEKVAINYADSNGSPYNCGTIVKDEFILTDGPSAYFSTLPIDRILKNLQQAHIPASQSLSAGAYGCNQVFYETMHYLAEINKTIPAGFIHLPQLPEQAIGSELPSMSFVMIKKAINIIIQSIASQS